MPNDEANVLKTIIDALKPLTSEERQRTLQAALVFLGEEAASSENKRKALAKMAKRRRSYKYSISQATAVRFRRHFGDRNGTPVTDVRSGR